VVLVHDGGGEREQTIAALTRLIPELKKQGWEFDLPKRTVRSKPLISTSPSADPEVSGPTAARK
jgi:hypothetical protein